MVYNEVPEYLSKRVRIRATTHPSPKYELMKRYVSHLCMQMLDMYAKVSLLLLRNTGTVFPDLRTISYFVTFKCRLYSHMLSFKCILLKYIIIRVFIYLFVLYINLKPINVYRFY